MHKNGHLGVNLLLSSPFISFFIIYELYVFMIVFLGLILMWSGLPDVDIYLQRYDDVSYSAYPVFHWPWVPIMQLTNLLMNFMGNYIEKVPTDYEMDSVTHRGLTHSLWFSIVFGFIVAALFSIIILSSMAIEIFYGIENYMALQQLLNANPLYLMIIGFSAGFLSVVFHCIGDIFTPTGIHFLTPRTDYGFTLDQFYAKNEVANRSALPLGMIMISYAIFFGIAYGQINTIYLVSGFIGLFVTLIPLWLVFVKTRIGKWVYIIYDFFT